MKYLKLFLKERKGRVALTLLLLLGQVITTLLIPYLIANIIDDGILKGDMAAIWRIGGWMLVTALAGAAVAVLGSFFSADLGARFGCEMRGKLFRKTQALPVHAFDSIGVSSMITRATSDIANMQQTLGMVLQMMVPAPMIVAASIVMTARNSIALSGVLISCMVLFLVCAWLLLKKSSGLSRKIQTGLDRINQVVRESITGIRVIRAFGNERHERRRAGEAFSAYADNMIRLNKLFALANPLVWLLIGVAMALVVWLGGASFLDGQMALGQITAVVEYAVQALGYLIMAAATATMLPKLRACLDRLDQVLDMSVAITDCHTEAEPADPQAPVVAFEHVSFRYPGAEEPVLQDLSLRCYPGQTIAIIGGTGAGKSTVASLLLRLHDVDGGCVRLRGVDIRSLPQSQVRATVAYVPQKAFLFSGTIESNLRMGRENAAEWELMDALETAQMADFVTELPLGLQAPVAQGGTNFSGGQKQRLCVARALVRKAAVYVFDDSFSALDSQTDAALRAALRQREQSAVKIIIAQRVSTILDADQILVLDEGQLAGVGTHETLLHTCPVYRAIAESQTRAKEA